MINNVSLIGRLTADPELKYTQSGLAVAQVTLAVERPYKNQSGEKETDFIRIVIWRKTAEALAEYAHKGAMIGVNGRVQTRDYTNNNGQKVYVTEVVVEELQLINTRTNEQSNESSYSKKATNNQSNYNNQSSSNNTDSGIDISDDDLPF